MKSRRVRRPGRPRATDKCRELATPSGRSQRAKGLSTFAAGQRKRGASRTKASAVNFTLKATEGVIDRVVPSVAFGFGGGLVPGWRHRMERNFT